ncbi:bifunctional ADP-dependent NAD(P)H-hydrate dehydratase/NAD(P)H-hydrate epimerase [Bifidobacterium aquikefiri]|uniref:Multifunctional fusion protein n=1 Tax=Bifidobacterium aquikefiri TaxID=1653207 RepID=A0A261G6J1_9BIFI|nr:bifunctional ADP-dependent NAD(P)H-hydrate dehydratase/NAD(P)H-hydrate epimerase [Bifidobacterium aquikefiri]OZG67014.1 carbohydrate kinase [Bifidobacterium aquikefiri]
MSSSFLSASAGSNSRVNVAAHDDFLCEAFDSQTVRALEKPLLDIGVPLMQTAASAVAATARVMLSHIDVELDQADVVVLAGGGDNGGDGLYAAAELSQAGASVSVVAVGRSLHPEGLDACLHSGVEIDAIDQQAIIPGCVTPSDSEESSERLEDVLSYIASAHLVIDAMTGIGLHGSLQGIPAAIADALGESGELPDRAALPNSMETHGLPLILAVDTPSGIGIDDGTLPGAYIPADVTVTFGALKPCSMLPPAAYVCGQVVVVDFGFDTEHIEPAVRATTMDASAQWIRLPHLSDSKYSRGVVGLVTGSEQYPGAAVMSSTAASASNVGMIRYCGPQRAEEMVLSRLPEAVTGAGHVQSWVVGSGVSVKDDDSQHRQIQDILDDYDIAMVDGTDIDDVDADEKVDESELSNNASQIRLSVNSSEATNAASGKRAQPCAVVDAGALPLLPGRVTANVILTPHAGELASLLASRGEDVSTEDVLAEPMKWGIRAWELTGATILLKGAITVIIFDDGLGNPTVITSGFAPAWTGTAGSGDVLAGIIGAVVAQNADALRENPYRIGECVAAGAYLHGIAARIASGSYQRGWTLPLLCDPHHARNFVQWLGDVLDGDTYATKPVLGHPIVASDIVAQIRASLTLLVENRVSYIAEIEEESEDEANTSADEDSEDMDDVSEDDDL